VKSEDKVAHINIYTGVAWEAIIIRYLLNNNGIKTWLTNEESEIIGQVSNLPYAWETLTIKISPLDYDRAKLIIANYEKHSQENKFQFEP
jgi:Putative prokaryotic signal transducing protein